MDKLTAKSNYSTGTIYNHFSCKEDVLSAIDINCLVENNYLPVPLSLKVMLKDVLLHYIMLNACLKPEQFVCILSCKTNNVTEKASTRRHTAYKKRSIRSGNGIIKSYYLNKVPVKL